MVIFVSSIGRSGTHFLARLFEACSDVSSHHLLEPHCHGGVMERAMQGERPAEIDEKIAVIDRIVAERGSYFETTPMFTRVLSGAVLERFGDVKVIQALRDPLEVARSYTNRESYPSHPDRPWRVPLNTPQARFRFPPGLTPFQENLCDWLDNELRFQELQPALAGTVTLLFDDYNDPEAMAGVFERLGVACDRERLAHHLAAHDLDRNANKVATEISAADRAEATELIARLAEAGFPTGRFAAAPYDAFWFTRTLAAAAPRVMDYNRFYREGGFGAATEEWLEENTDLRSFAASFGDRRPTLLDAGCGDGEWTALLARWYCATGIDLAREGIELAERRAHENLRFRCMDFHDLGEDEQFDVIFCRAPSFLNHPTDSPILAANIRRLLRHCRRRLYYIKYSKAPFERWVPSRVFANFDTDAVAAPDSRWYYNDPEKLEARLREIAVAKVRLRGNYLVATVDAPPDPAGDGGEPR